MEGELLSRQKIIISMKLINNIVTRCTGIDEEKVFVGVGVAEGNVYRVEEVFECRNVAQNPTVKFIADPMCLYKVFKYAEGKGMDVVLLAHSHPALPEPSSEDLKGMKLWRIPWLIISSLSGEYRAWILSDNELIELEVELI
jgi:proteasome lid subunit RPN8/RPN11